MLWSQRVTVVVEAETSKSLLERLPVALAAACLSRVARVFRLTLVILPWRLEPHRVLVLTVAMPRYRLDSRRNRTVENCSCEPEAAVWVGAGETSKCPAVHPMEAQVVLSPYRLRLEMECRVETC